MPWKRGRDVHMPEDARAPVVLRLASAMLDITALEGAP